MADISLSNEFTRGATITGQPLFDSLNSYKNYFSDLNNSISGRNIGYSFSNFGGFNVSSDNISQNVSNLSTLTDGIQKDTLSSLASTGVGLASNYIGQGINYLGGDSRLSRGIGQGVATGLGTIGGTAVSNLIKYGRVAGQADKLFGTMDNARKAAKIAKLTANGASSSEIAKISNKATGAINPYGLAMTVAGTALGAVTGPSKEYGGKYGAVTQTMDSVYDGLTTAINFVPGWGQIASGAMALNKGLSNVFGSTDGMTLQDSILGSAFMPFPVKWVNMWDSNTTSKLDKYSYLNQNRVDRFMGNAFGDTGDKIYKAIDEQGKTYGTFSQGAYDKAQANIKYVNSIYDDLLAMTDQNELQNIRAFDMDTINNQRYAQMIQGGWQPVSVGKQGMKISNNEINHNIGQRLLSGAALIDNKAMILSAGNGTKIPKLQTAWQPIQSDNTRVQRPLVTEPIERKLRPGQQFFNNHGQIVVVEPRQEYVYQDNRIDQQREESHQKSVQVRKQEQMKKAEEQTAQVAGALLERTTPSFWLQQATGEDLGTAGSLAVDLASPFVLGKGIQLLGKTGQGINKLARLGISPYTRSHPGSPVAFIEETSENVAKRSLPESGMKPFIDDYGKEVIPTPWKGTDQQLLDLIQSNQVNVLRDYFSPQKKEQIMKAMGWGEKEYAEFQDELLRSIETLAKGEVKGVKDGFTILAQHRGQAVGEGKDMTGKHIMTFNRDRIADEKMATEAIIHEIGGHGKTMGINPNKPNQISEAFPRITQLMQKNQELANSILEFNGRGRFFSQFPKVSDLEIYTYNNHTPRHKLQKLFDQRRYFQYLTNDIQERAARAYTGQLMDKLGFSKTLNIQQLEKYYTPESVEKFKNAVLNYGVPITVGGSTAATLYNQTK